MSYCTASDVKGELSLPLLRQMEAGLGDGFDAFLLTEIGKAEDYVNVRLSGSFPVPFDEVPASVKTITVKMATYFALARFAEREGIGADKKEIAEAMITSLIDSRVAPGVENSVIRSGSDDEVFTKAALSMWNPSP